MSALLEVKNVEAAYGPVKAVRGVSLSVPDGKIATVLGPNGAGKTTLLKTLSGINDPKRGSVIFGGQDVTGLDPSEIVRQGLVQLWCTNLL